MQMAVDHQQDTAGFFLIGIVDNIPNILPVFNAVCLPLDTLVADHHTGIGRICNGLFQPRQLLRGDIVPCRLHGKIVAAVVMDVFPVIVAVIGVINNKTVALAVKEIMSVRHVVRFQGLLIGCAVTVMVAKAVIAGNMEFVVCLDVIRCLADIVAEITGMDDKIHLLGFRPLLDLLQILPRSAHKNPRGMMQICKHQKFHIALSFCFFIYCLRIY